MNRKVKQFKPEPCDIVIIDNSKIKGYLYTILKEDGKEYNIVGKGHKYDEKSKELTINKFDSMLPVVIEIDNNFIVNRTKEG